MAIEWGFGLTIRPQGPLFRDWAENHKTMVFLNGGNQASLQELRDYFTSPDNPYAWGHFSEDEQSLNNCLTCVGIVLPEKIYLSAQLIRTRTCDVHNVENDGGKGKWIVSNDRVSEYELTMWEFGLIERLNNCGLAV